MTLYNVNEIVALITAVLIGTGAYIGVVNLKKKEKINVNFIISVLFINLFITYVISEVLTWKELGQFRTFGLPAVAFFGQYVIDWVDRKYLKIFDSVAKRVGVDVTEDDKPKEHIEKLDDYENNNKEGGIN